VITPNDGLETEIHFLAYVPYKGQYLLLYEYGWYHPDGSGAFGRYSADIRLAHSRDGEHFTRICPHQKVIERGQLGAWDDQFLVIGDKIVVKDDMMYLYYAGQDRTWTSWPKENIKQGLSKLASGDKRAGGIRHTHTGLALLPVDRFTALETKDGETPGFARTVAIQLPREPTRILANLSATQPRRSWLSAEVLDLNGQPLDGFQREHSAMLAEDSMGTPLAWSRRTLGELAGRQVRLRVWLHGSARLHSLTFAAPQ